MFPHGGVKQLRKGIGMVPIFKIVTVLVIWFSLGWGSAPVQAEPAVSAASYLLLEAASGQVLLEYNGYQPRPPASTTKILTAITALDLAEVTEVATVSPNADRIGDASIYLEAGEMFTLEGLLQGALIKSGNDATVAIAEQVAGTERLFMDLVNRKAHLLGAIHTDFYNPHGLPHEKHLTTAYDLALIAEYAMRNPVFASMVRTQETSISALNTKRKIKLKNTNRLLWTDQGVIGVKTGTTDRAGRCLVAAAEREGRSLIAVVLKSADRFGDALRLLDLGYEQYSLYRLPETIGCLVLDVRGGEPSCVTVKPAYQPVWSLPGGKKLAVQLSVPETLAAPIKEGDVVGKIIVSYNGKLLEEIPLAAGENVRKKKWKLGLGS